eukprot:2201431-Amphidinium_carterae.1
MAPSPKNKRDVSELAPILDHSYSLRPLPADEPLGPQTPVHSTMAIAAAAAATASATLASAPAASTERGDDDTSIPLDQ